jgi:hypothetical protein
MMTDHVDHRTETGCTMIVLDVLTGNFTAHRFCITIKDTAQGISF